MSRKWGEFLDIALHTMIEKPPKMPSARRPSVVGESPCAACGIREFALCAALENQQEMDELARLQTSMDHTAGSNIFYEDDPARHLFVIVEGCVKIYKLLADGRRQITGFLYPSDFLGIALRDRYSYTAEAITDVHVCRFERRGFETLLEKFPRLEKRLLGIASNELASAQDQMLLLGRKTADERVATFLYMLSRRAYLKNKGVERLPLPMSRNDIADHLGLTTETVSRCFTRLRKKGVVVFTDPHDLAIADWHAFSELVGIDDTLMPNTAA